MFSYLAVSCEDEEPGFYFVDTSADDRYMREFLTPLLEIFTLKIIMEILVHLDY